MISKVISLGVTEGGMGTMPWGSSGSPPVNTNKLCVVLWYRKSKSKRRVKIGVRAGQGQGQEQEQQRRLCGVPVLHYSEVIHQFRAVGHAEEEEVYLLSNRC